MMADMQHPPPASDDGTRFRSGFVVLLGRPNSGKSTLLNTVIGRELSPVTPLPQTTRRKIAGVYTAPSLQIVFIDTPGIHRSGHWFNRAMLSEAENAARDAGVDCLCYIVDLSRDAGEEESLAAAVAKASSAPRLIVFNKKDLCASPETERTRFFSRFPALAGTPQVTISAADRRTKKIFLAALDPFIRHGPCYFDNETLTDAPLRSLAAEFIRKHLILATRNEVPHAAFVSIESYREAENRHDIRAVIHVETTGQRGIIIGRKGALLKRICRTAGTELEGLSGCPVRISCHVTVTPKWRDDQNFLRQFRYFPA